MIGAQQVPHRIAQLLVERLVSQTLTELPIVINRARDHASVELLGAFGVRENVEAEALLRPVLKPLLNRQAIAFRLGDLLALFIEEKLIDETFGLVPAKDTRNLARLDTSVGQILAVHFVVNAKRHPAHGEVDFPLELGLAAKRALLDHFAVFIGETDHASVRIDHFDRHLQHDARLGRDWHDRRISRRALSPKGGEHNVEDRLVVAKNVL